MISVNDAKKIMGVSTYNQLTKLLYTLEHVTAPRDIRRTQDKLRELISNLLSFKNVLELHTDHIIELAETIAGLYPERDDLDGYIYHILPYINKKLKRYDEICMRYRQQLKQMGKVRDQDPEGYLNLRYKVWTYTDGYYHQQAHMYQLLRSLLRDLSDYARRGIICKNTAKKQLKTT